MHKLQWQSLKGGGYCESEWVSSTYYCNCGSCYIASIWAFTTMKLNSAELYEKVYLYGILPLYPTLKGVFSYISD